ncbi:MAG: NUDIX domain-containing protein, partial [Acidimicrobiaceae bacterium]|nr:NUDIX domain-containing protein [Acidimicrobiaceae bacterium]
SRELLLQAAAVSEPSGFAQVPDSVEPLVDDAAAPEAVESGMAAASVAKPPVRAAGGAVWQRGAGGIEVLLIHRPRYDDWSLPKGKLDPGETDEQAALREVFEETSVVGRLGAELVSTAYLDRSGKYKTVRYWAMTVAEGEPRAANEVDQVAWLSLPDARGLLSYARDHAVLDELALVVGAAASLEVRDMDHVVLWVADVERSLRFWCGQLGLEGVRLEAWRRGEVPFPSVRVSDGTIIDLLAAGKRDSGRRAPSRRDSEQTGAGPPGQGLDHLCLVVAATDLEAVARSGAFTVVEGPVPRFGARGMGTSLYVRDPDGYLVELRHY